MSFAAVFDHEQPQNFLYTFADREAVGRMDGRTDGRPPPSTKSCRRHITKISIAELFYFTVVPAAAARLQNVVALEKANTQRHRKSEGSSHIGVKYYWIFLEPKAKGFVGDLNFLLFTAAGVRL